jgi:hypothetical protein
MQIEPPTLTRMRPATVRLRRGATAAITAVACAALVSACGGSSSTSSTPATTTVNTAQVAASIKETVLTKRHLHVTVVCPAAVPAEKAKTFECIATGHSATPPHALTKTPFLVTIQSNKGYVTYVGK